MAELWDVYDQHGVRLEGVVLTRGQPIPQGMYHLVSDVLVQHADGSYLITKRAPCKHHGDMWEATSGGSALQGETPLEAAQRELWEETGLLARQWQQVDNSVNHARQCLFVEHLCVTDAPKDSVRLQEGETVDYRWVSCDELLAMRDNEMLSRRMLACLRAMA